MDIRLETQNSFREDVVIKHIDEEEWTISKCPLTSYRENYKMQYIKFLEAIPHMCVHEIEYLMHFERENSERKQDFVPNINDVDLTDW